MNPAIPRVVFDCNVFLQSLISKNGPANRCKQFAVDGKIILFVSDFVLAEIRKLPRHPRLARLKSLTDDMIEAYLADLLPKVVFLDFVPSVFMYVRDPADAHYIDLAVAANAIYLVSRDNDLLNLMAPATAEGLHFQGQFPNLRILAPDDLLRDIERIPQR